MKTFKNSLEKILTSWIYDHSSVKIGEFKLSFVEETSKYDKEVIDDEKKLGEYFDNFLEETKKLKTMEDIKAFVKKFSFSFGKELAMDLKNELKDEKLSESDLMAGTKTLQTIQNKMVEIIAKTQINSYIRMIDDNLSLFDTLLSKIGPDTIIDEVEIEDLEYILNQDFSKFVEKFREWNKRNPDKKDFYKDELKVLDIKNSSIEEKTKASETIYHYFTNILLKEINIKKLLTDDDCENDEIYDEEIDEIDDDEIKSDDDEKSLFMPKFTAKEQEKFYNYNKGVVLSERLISKMNITNTIIEKVKEMKKQ